MIRELVERCRSFRRFFEDEAVDRDTLRGLVALARLAPTAANLQPLKYVISCEPETNLKVYPHLRWAGYLKDWPGPGEGERPPAFIIILLDREISETVDCDHGIAAQTMLLGAAEAGLGGCIISNIDRDGLTAALGIPGRFRILLAVAVGRPRETVRMEPLRPGGEVRYWRDSAGVHHVPKRGLDDLIVELPARK
ncbi:MAG: nitroreductase family protein [Thermodesulfobacteriota bacterium]